MGKMSVDPYVRTYSTIWFDNDSFYKKKIIMYRDGTKMAHSLEIEFYCVLSKMGILK